MIAFRVLGLDFTNDDETVRKAYLSKITRFPPEKAPEQYKIVRRAYEMIKSEQKRMEYYLFGNREEITAEEYESVCLEIDKSITSEKWDTLCRMYQKSKSKPESGS